MTPSNSCEDAFESCIVFHVLVLIKNYMCLINLDVADISNLLVDLKCLFPTLIPVDTNKTGI
jgi:hypothetical protein